MLLGSQDIYRSGLKVYTTLDLDYQKVADEVMQEGIARVNELYREQSDTRARHGDATFVPLAEVLALMFDLGDVEAAGSRQRSETEGIFHREMGPVMDLVSTLFDLQELKKPAQVSAMQLRREEQKNIVEGALVCIDSHTGSVYAVVGGSQFSSANQFNRAVQGGLQPGSSFKPLYYSAAIEQRKVTAATMLMDRPSVFWNDDGTPYVPLNFRGEWQGRVAVRTALMRSMNVPSLKVLEAVGFDAAIERAAKLLGITDRAEIEANFPRKYPLGLGVCSVSPLQMARAFAAFANQGRGVEPVAIRYVQDRDGRTILEPEREAMARMRRPEAQVMSPQAAYVMTDILRDTVRKGTLAHAAWKVGGFDELPIAGKTGTTQNWSDAWTIGYTPRVTTAVWFGFDAPGNSLGLDVTGATAAGPVWAEFMKRIHGNAPPEEFSAPVEGIAHVAVSELSGMLPTPGEPAREEVFIAGTEPRTFSDLPAKEAEIRQNIVENLRRSLFQMSFETPAGQGLFAEQNPFEDGREPVPSDRKNPLLD
jgi:penicillin-binding protein 1A